MEDYKQNNNSLDLKDSQLIDVLRIPLVVIIIFIHILPFTPQSVDLSFNQENIYNFFTELVSHSIGYIANSAFFLLSGYFFFLKTDTFNLDFYTKQLKKRFHTLLIPYVLWNLIMLAATVIVEYIKSATSAASFDFTQYLSLSLLFDTFTIPLNYPLWFVRELIILSIISPVIYFIIRYLKDAGIVILIILYFIGFRNNLLNDFSIGFFGMGSYFGINKINIVKLSTNKLLKLISYFISIIGFPAAVLLSNTPYHIYVVKFCSIFGIIALINIIHNIYLYKKINNKILRVSNASFFIIGLHMIYILPWMKGFLSTLENHLNKIELLTIYFLIPFIVFTICYYVYIIGVKIFPKTVSLLNGGR